MVRDLIMLPGVPRRLLDDLGELKQLVRDLLVTEEELTRTSSATDRKVAELETTNDRLEQALQELRGLNGRLDRLDARVERLDTEIRSIRSATDEIKEVVPDVGRGALAKARDALTGE